MEGVGSDLEEDEVHLHSVGTQEENEAGVPSFPGTPERDTPRNSEMQSPSDDEDTFLASNNTLDGNRSNQLSGIGQGGSTNSEELREETSGSAIASTSSGTQGQNRILPSSGHNGEDTPISDIAPSTRKVRQFRAVTGEDGEISYVFDSESDSSSESDDDVVVNVAVPNPTLPVRRTRINNSLLDLVDRDPSRQDSSSDDPDYMPNWLRRSNPLRSVSPSRSGLNSSASGEPIPGPSSGLDYSRSPSRRRKTASPKPKPVRKSLKKSRPLRPLLPKTLVHHVNDNIPPDMESHFKSLINKCSYHCNLSFEAFDRKKEIEIVDEKPDLNQTEGFVIGSVELSVVEEPLVELQDFTIESIQRKIPGLHGLILHVNEETNQSVLVIQTQSLLSDDECKIIKLSSDLKKSELRRKYYYMAQRNQYYQIDLGGICCEVFGGLENKRLFRLDINDYNQTEKLLKVNVILLNSAIQPQHEIEAVRIRNFNLLEIVMNYFFNVSQKENYDKDQTVMQGKEDIEWFYGQIKKYHQHETLPFTGSVQHPSLIPTLRDYQKNAVQWMLCRENNSFSGNANKIDLAEAFLNEMFMPIELKPVRQDLCNLESETKQSYYSPYFGTFAWNLPSLPQIGSGGILCDEMGLGKTVEVLSLVLLNQCKHLDPVKDESFSSEILKEGSPVEPPTPENDMESVETTTKRSISRKRKKRKRLTRQKGGKRAGRAPKRELSTNQVEDLAQMVQTSLLSPAKRKRRDASPCEFETLHLQSPLEEQCRKDDEISKKSEQSTMEEKCPKDVDQSNESEQVPARKTKRAHSNSLFEDGRMPSTYDRIKVNYDITLSRYSESSKLSKKFGGEFFNPNIKLKPYFGCICGEYEQSDSKYIVTCGLCNSSQHAECVGFEVRNRMSAANYLCPHCTATQLPIDIKSTLIITPTTISHQWIQEIQKHVKNEHLKILFYKGVSNHGYIPPSKLAQYDIIITTYSVLSQELNYVDLPHCSSVHSKQFRNPKRYLTIPSPLLSVNFWRICLDEAQMVEGSTTKVALMALRLTSVNKWCVTGTPMSKGLEDLYGLFAFFELQPINVKFWWNSLVSKSFYQKDDCLFELFGQLIWRTCKSEVLHQLGIPPQSELVHWSKFSPLETHFYKRQFEVCSDKILEKINDPRHLQKNGNESYETFLQKKLTQLDRNFLSGLLAPFLALRQACVHPQMVKGNWLSLNKLKGNLTMKELLDQLIRRSTLQCVDDNRLIVSSLNAMAGLYILEQNFVEAANKYREVLAQEQKYRDKFKTDSLQMIHTLENLADVLDGNYAGVGYTLRDDSLRNEADEIKKKYLEGYANDVEAARNVIIPVTLSIRELDSKLMGRTQSWWVSALSLIQDARKDQDLIERIREVLADKSTKKKAHATSIVNRFNDLNGLELVLVQKLLELNQLRSKVEKSLEKLGTMDPQTLVDGAALCHLRKQREEAYYYYNEHSTGYKCTLCSYHDKFLQYESVLFTEEKIDKITRTGRNYQKVKLGGRTLDQLTQEELELVLIQEQEELFESTEHAWLKGVLRHGNWGPSETEKVLKAILGFAKLNGGGQRLINDGTNHIKLLDAAKKEFKLNRILWRKLYDQVSALDELKQATTRLRLATPEEIREELTASTSAKHRKATAPSSNTQLSYNVGDEKIQNIHILKPHEIAQRMHQSQIDCEVGKQNLAVHMGQIIYLETLKKNDYGKKGTTNTDECAICSNQLGHEWSVLICGHSFCTECVKKMCPNPQSSIQCPMCRMVTKFKDISFVDTKIDTSEESETTVSEPQPSTSKAASLPSNSMANQLHKIVLTKEVKGSHSSKIGSIIETLLKLQISHPLEKVIIFSSWGEVLEIIGRALEENDIQYCLLTSGKAFQKSLNRFKSRLDMQVLLMPMASGSKGLNIIEATHVFLVEPTLNLANELQAIGRVHRIGQTKPTFVHRFYVKQTIEEQLFEILKTQDITSDDEGSLTIADLKHLVAK